MAVLGQRGDLNSNNAAAQAKSPGLPATPCTRCGRRAMRHNPAVGAIIIMPRSL
jgi:hypothetical protein